METLLAVFAWEFWFFSMQGCLLLRSRRMTLVKGMQSIRLLYRILIDDLRFVGWKAVVVKCIVAVYLLWYYIKKMYFYVFIFQKCFFKFIEAMFFTSLMKLPISHCATIRVSWIKGKEETLNWKITSNYNRIFGIVISNWFHELPLTIISNLL